MDSPTKCPTTAGVGPAVVDGMAKSPEDGSESLFAKSVLDLFTRLFEIPASLVGHAVGLESLVVRRAADRTLGFASSDLKHVPGLVFHGHLVPFHWRGDLRPSLQTLATNSSFVVIE